MSERSKVIRNMDRHQPRARAHFQHIASGVPFSVTTPNQLTRNFIYDNNLNAIVVQKRTHTHAQEPDLPPAEQKNPKFHTAAASDEKEPIN